MISSTLQMQQSLHFRKLEGDPGKVHIIESKTSTDVFNRKACEVYFKTVFKHLVGRSTGTSKGITKVGIIEYTQLPGMLAERFFAVLDSNNNGFINEEEFVSGMLTIYAGSITSRIRLIFNIYDFDKDQFITKEDIKVVLAYIPINKILADKAVEKEGIFTQEGGGYGVYYDRVESQEQIEELILECFGKEDKMPYEVFEDLNKNHFSDLFVTIMTVLKDRIPCSHDFRRFQTEEEVIMQELDEMLNEEESPQTIASPRVLSKFTPVSPLLDDQSPKRTSFKGSTLSKEQQTAKDKLSLIIPLAQRKTGSQREMGTNSNLLKPDMNTQVNGFPTFRGNQAAHFKEMLSNFEELSNSLLGESTDKVEVKKGPPKINKEDKEKLEAFKSSPDLMNKIPMDGLSTKEAEEPISRVKMEGEVFKQAKDKSFAKIWWVLEDKDLYVYKSQEASHPKTVYPLTGMYVKEVFENINEPTSDFSSFNLIFHPKKSRTFCTAKKEDRERWVSLIKQVTGCTNVYNFYEIKEKLGNGQYGFVRAAVHKKTGKKVAVKIVRKNKLTPDEYEFLKHELEILKVCQHPNTIRLYDIFENSDYIYIIMELLKGGDLFGYLSERNFKIPEERARKIVHGIATSLYYLKSYGIVHRDIKPENIMLEDESESSEVKLVDFGLSKIVGPSQKLTGAFGTLSYIAPEVLFNVPYDSSVDLWALGINTYLLLTGCLPFDHKEDREIVKMTCYFDADYKSAHWKGVSKEAKNFVDKLLQKKPEKRMTLEQTLEEPWLSKGNKKTIISRKKSAKEGTLKFKWYSHAKPDSSSIMEEIDELYKA